MPKELTWRKSIEKVLSKAPGAIHYSRLSALLSHNILKLAGKTIQYDVLAVLSLGVFAS